MMLRTLSSRALGAALFASALAACSTPPTQGDADVNNVDAFDESLVFVDAGPTIAMFTPCDTTADCDPTLDDAGAAQACDRTYPGGICRKIACRQDSECGPRGICTELNGCVPRCALDSDTCNAFGGVCQSHALPLETRTGCFPLCERTATTGVPACEATLMCDPWRGNCVSRLVDTGAANGDPCVADIDCRSGRCIPALDPADRSAPTGFVGGYCVSVARLPTEAVFRTAAGMNLPQSSCPDGSAMLPNASRAPGSAARCLKACMTDGDCRGGYLCNHSAAPGGTTPYRNGVCTPIDCSVAGATCPSGTRCITRSLGDGGVTSSLCGNPIESGDGGASDAATDATTDAITDAAASDSGPSDAMAADASAG